MASKENLLDFIEKSKRKLKDLLQTEPESLLSIMNSHQLLTEKQFSFLSQEKDPCNLIKCLMDIVEQMPESSHKLFLECLENLREFSTSLEKASEHIHADCSPTECPSETQDNCCCGPVHTMEKNTPDSQDDTVTSLQNGPEDSKDKVFNFLTKLGLSSRRLSIAEILVIDSKSFRTMPPQSLEELPWHFLKKLMAVNGTARNTGLVLKAEEDSNEEMDTEDELFSLRETDPGISVNPLDVLCAILVSSDSFLQQEILLKMSMCQFALPLILPPIDTPKCSFMLWAMRDIVRKWRPHSLKESRGFREESLVLISTPTISFVRLGNCTLSKSKLLNEVLSSPQHHHDFFLHRDMECGNVPREISNGLVEISWYFPGGRENSDLFPEPLAFLNLRGDIESHGLQFSFLTQVSSAMFIVADNISDKDYNMLASLQRPTSKYYFILNNEDGKLKESLGLLNKLALVLNMSKSQLLVKEKTQNTTEFVKKLRLTIRNIDDSRKKMVNMEKMADIGRELEIQIDEDVEDCQNGTLKAMRIIEEIKGNDIANYKKEMLKLQGDLWKSVGRVEKEMCRMKWQGDTQIEDYKSQLKEKRIALRWQQSQCEFTPGISKFITAINNLSPMEKRFFLKWLKFHLDDIARTNLLTLREKYKEKCQGAKNNPQELTKLSESISASSLGMEHFMRELGQFYEAECLMVKEGKISSDSRQFANLPGIAADLMLEGFPMELIDGDASNIPLQWITDILTELHVKLGGKSRMQVLTVLGVQSTGKSTLLNTMFGLQFAVSSGRCTRGAFMTLLRVAKDFQQELGCDFILVIDTEGLKAPELAKLDDSYEHDNELATLVIGLSDITIVNMAMENAAEMKDILQIVVHAFLRMEQTGHQPNCQFVHQNVSDVSAHEQNMRDRRRLLEQLDEMTRAAARMEKQFKEVSFSDIMEYDPEKHNWYIPGLWHGVPPMAPVNMGYSESLSELKGNLFEFMKTRSSKRPSKNIPQFAEWVKSLWNAVKHENFIFSFRNSLVADAYNQLSVKFSEWEWNFQKEMHLWVCKVDSSIQNLSLEDLEAGSLDELRAEGYQKLQDGRQEMIQCLHNYFESGGENLHLIEKYREDFERSVNFVQKQLESYSMNKFQESILIRKGQDKIDRLQSQYLKTMEGKVNKLLEICRSKDCELSPKELKQEFEKMWKETLEVLPANFLPHRHIYREVFHQLRKDLECWGGLANQRLQKLFEKFHYGTMDFRMKQKNIKKQGNIFEGNYLGEINNAVRSLIDTCSNYVKEKVSTKGDYNEIYCCELLSIINNRLQDKDFHNLHISIDFAVDLKYHILMDSADAFQEMHDEFVKTNSPHQRLESLRAQYFSIFKDLYLEKDACQKRARDFCELCLKPALMDYLNKKLGVEIVDDLLSSRQSIKYGSRSFFQFTVLKNLLKEEKFNDYVEYINNYKDFVKSWIQDQLLGYYQQREDMAKLETEILNSVIKKTKVILESSETQFMDLPKLLEYFCHKMSEELVISKDSLKVTLFNTDFKAADFSTEILSYLPEVMEEILSDRFKVNVETILSNLSLKPQDEIFKRVFGCGKQCPFCKVPCEAGGSYHQQHFASIHRPQGLCARTYFVSEGGQDVLKDLVCSICSSDVASNACFINRDTNFKLHPYKDYQQYYPDWLIQPDPSITASDYWKFVFHRFNQQFADEYNVLPAKIPDDWEKITKAQALESIQESFCMK